MAQDVIVDLGSFSISSHLDTNFVLTLSTSVLLSYPERCPEPPTAAELRDQVKAGLLWITRAGSCQVELNIGLGDSLEPGSLEQLQRMIVEAFEAFPAWTSLGLKLRREYNQFNGFQGARSLFPYSVHHHQQNSGLVSPDQVPCAHFTALSCNFTFGARNPQEARPSGHVVANTPQHRKSRLVTLQVPPSGLRAVLGIPHIYSLPVSTQKMRLEHLTHTALHLILGSRKRIAGIRTLKQAGYPTILDIAPAVWNSRYFQNVVSRAQMAPFICTPLGALDSIQSPALRHKIEILAVDPVEELHRLALLLVLRSARVGKIRYRHQQSMPQPGGIECPGGDDQNEYPGDFDEGDQLLEPFQEAEDDPIYDYALSPVGVEQDGDGYMSDLVQHYDSPAYNDAFDEQSLSDQEMEYNPEHYLLYSVSENLEDLIDPLLLRDSGELDSEPSSRTDASDDEDLHGMEDGVHPQQRPDLFADDMDDYDEEDSLEAHQLSLFTNDMEDCCEEEFQGYPLEDHMSWVPNHFDLQQRQDDLDDDSMIGDEENQYGIYCGDFAPQQQHDLPFDDVDGMNAQHTHMSSEEPVELSHGHLEQDLHYESDDQVDQAGRLIDDDAWDDLEQNLQNASDDDDQMNQADAEELMSNDAWDDLDRHSEQFVERYQYEHMFARSYESFADEDPIDGAAADIEDGADSQYSGTEGSDFETGKIGSEALSSNGSEIRYGPYRRSGLDSSENSRDNTDCGHEASDRTVAAFILHTWGLASLEVED